MKNLQRWLLVLALLLFTLVGYWLWQRSSQQVRLTPIWVTGLQGGYTASPHLGNFNDDEVLDVIAAGGYEGQWGKVHLLDGKSGEPIWMQKFTDEPIFARPLLDTNGDGTVDVFVGCRRLNGDFTAHDGKTGEVLWSLKGSNKDAGIPSINFMNAIVLSDFDDDGVSELLLVQTGGQDELRIPAQLSVISGASGKILHQGTTPDQRECYCVPAYHRDEEGEWIVLGTGGETISGHLYKLRLPSLEVAWSVATPTPALGVAKSPANVSSTGPPSDAQREGFVDKSAPKGFVAAPLICDLERDKRWEVVAGVLDGDVLCVDFNSGKVRWTARAHQLVANYPTPLPGHFNGDDTLDLVLVMSKGRSSEYFNDHLIWVDGRNGKTIAQLTFPDHHINASTPLVLDLENDGRDEVAVLFNNAESPFDPVAEQLLAVVRCGDEEAEAVFVQRLPGFSVTTPAIADIDRDGQIDLLHTGSKGITRFEFALPLGAKTPIHQAEFRYGP